MKKLKENILYMAVATALVASASVSWAAYSSASAKVSPSDSKCATLCGGLGGCGEGCACSGAYCGLIVVGQDPGDN